MGSAHLDDAVKEAIRRDYMTGLSCREVASRRGVSYDTAWRLTRGMEVPDARVWVEDGRVVVESVLPVEVQLSRVIVSLRKRGQKVEWVR